MKEVISEKSIDQNARLDHLNAIYEKSPIGIIFSDYNGVILNANPRFEEILGYNTIDLNNTSVLDITFEDDVETCSNHLEILRKGRTDSFEVEKRFITKSGEIVTCITQVVAHHDPKYGDPFLTIMISDISDRKKNEQRSLSVIEATTSIIWTTGRFGEICSEQLSWGNFTGQSWEEHKEFGWVDKIFIDDREQFLDDWKNAYRKCINFESSGKIWHDKSLTWHDFEVKGIPLLDDYGKIREWVGVITDITIRVEATKKLEAQAQELQQLNYITSHNLKSPISNIEGLINMFDKEALSDRNLRVFELMSKATQGMKTSMERLSEAVAAKNSFFMLSECISIKESYEEATKGLAFIIEDSKAKISTNFEATDSIVFPSLHLVSILQNMISNALKYAHPDRPPEISLTTELSNEYVTVSISDNGLGMDLKLIEGKLFGLYQRYHTEQEGTGVGLYLVKATLENYGGKIEV
ncbi:MAG: PAS domain S-box protein, partial [Flavobacteriales bacterium]|nr:PAS domain S-box protein [Flavobacteriales bacterium]